MPADRELREVYGHLAARDDVLADLVRRHGRPDPFRWSPAYDAARTTFASLILHIISQQISTVVAVQLFRRVEAAAGGTLDPGGVVGLGTERLRELGLSSACRCWRPAQRPSSVSPRGTWRGRWTPTASPEPPTTR